MPVSLDPAANPILRLYGLFGRPGVEAQDGARYLGIKSARLRDFGSQPAQELIQFLLKSARNALHSCRLKLADQPLINFAAGSVVDWFEWDVIDDLASQGSLADACQAALAEWKSRLEKYGQDQYWPQGRDVVADCLSVLDELDACGSEDPPFVLEVILDKGALLEQHLLGAFPGLSGKVSILMWQDVESMVKAFAGFRSFLELVAQAARHPILLLFHEPIEPYGGDYFRVLSLGDPAGTLEARQGALAGQLQAFTPEILIEYDELRMRHKYESRPNVGERLDLPPALLLRQAIQESSYPAHSLFQAGPWRSLQVYLLMAWLAETTEPQDGAIRFALPSVGKVILEFELEDVREGGKSLFQAEKWQDLLVPIVRDVQRSAGRATRRTLWLQALAGRSLGDFTAGKFFSTLQSVHGHFAELEREYPRIRNQPLDLKLRIFLDAEERQFDFLLDSPSGRFDFGDKEVGSIPIGKGDLGKRFQDLDRLAEQELTRILVPDEPLAPGPMPGIDHLTIEGRDLWKDLVPDELKAAYEKFRGKNKGNVTLLIVSNDSSFPWELVTPYKADEKSFYDLWWAVEFSLARWLAGYPLPASRIGFRKVCCVATSSQLSSAAKELGFFEQAAVQLDAPQTHDELLKLLCEKDYDILHFACHGTFDTGQPDKSVVQLPDGSLLRPKNLLLRVNEITQRFRQNRPLVFLNACHSGRIGPSLTHLEGWAESFVDMGCGAFIGCGWEVADPLAADFAVLFYDRFRAGRTLGQAVHAARDRIRQDHPDNSTWLAYYLYGDPNCLLKEPG